MPQALQDMLSGQTALLQALSARLALESSYVRINIDELLKEASLVGRHNLTTLDLQRMLALKSGNSIAFRIENFGSAGISLVEHGHAEGPMIINTTKERHALEAALLHAWHVWLGTRPESSVDAFIESLPIATIHDSETIKKTASLFAKGKQRLSDIRQCRADVKQASATQDVQAAHANNAAVKDRSASLLDRIIAKQAHIATLPAGPTRADLERKAALHRIEEIARVLDVLSAGRARASFSMQSVIQQLQQSLRNPISRIEAERSLGLMAEEVMPSYVTIISSGNMVGVVITKAGKLSFADMKRRIADAC